ncbi:cytidylate kinase-like family protein [Sulfuricella sp.]|uniref:cytidylate kinase-like family protein n=1 Tax=Sulfuricella sp. TaxID=2099377 RepID=UPI002B5B6638|nr:cytidylate kinase-like family protein [Sulfuricella sp.]HUX63101.1 cytidylate kinase-like family protein [Sulfuricella sp.]
MTVDATKLVEAILKAHAAEMHGGRGAERPVVTLSRDYGSGGREIAQQLAKHLAVPVYDKELLDAVVERSGADPHLLAQLDEKTRGFWDSWIVSMLSGENVLDDNYRRHLVKVVLGIFNTGKGGVIIGRGAHLILAQQNVFRVRIIASPETCAERVAHKRQISLEEARKEVARVNGDRAKFIWDVFKKRLNEPAAFDLTINTDHLSKYEEVAEIIIFAMQYHHRNIS